MLIRPILERLELCHFLNFLYTAIILVQLGAVLEWKFMRNFFNLLFIRPANGMRSRGGNMGER